MRSVIDKFVIRIMGYLMILSSVPVHVSTKLPSILNANLLHHSCLTALVLTADWLTGVFRLIYSIIAHTCRRLVLRTYISIAIFAATQLND